MRPFELEVEATKGDAWGLAALREMDRAESYLRSEYGVSAVMSPSVVMKAMNKAANGGDPHSSPCPRTKRLRAAWHAWPGQRLAQHCLHR